MTHVCDSSHFQRNEFVCKSVSTSLVLCKVPCDMMLIRAIQEFLRSETEAWVGSSVQPGEELGFPAVSRAWSGQTSRLRKELVDGAVKGKRG